jgi:hypothetical protein
LLLNHGRRDHTEAHGVCVDKGCGHIEYQGELVEGVEWAGLTKRGQALFKRGSVGILEACVDGIEAEARLHVLINSDGTEQTAQDLARAAALAGHGA